MLKCSFRAARHSKSDASNRSSFDPLRVRISFRSANVIRPNGVALVQTRFRVNGDSGDVW